MPDGTSPTRRLTQRLDALAIELDRDTVLRLIAFIELLARWNRVHNLTAVRERLDMVERHLVDSLRLLPILRRLVGERSAREPAADFDLLDIGSGAGLPSIPIAICEPGWRVCSVESNGKKARFQRQAAIALSLDALDVRQQRIEQVRASARTLTARAFAAPSRVLELASAHVVVQGHVLLMPGRDTVVPDPLPDGWMPVDVTAAAGTAGGIVTCRRVETRGG